jgi:helicase
MGIEWLSLREFEQTLGRAGRPDYHDKGTGYCSSNPIVATTTRRR